MKSMNKILVICCILLFSGCAENSFEDFYENKRTDIQAGNVIEYLESKTELSTFVECLKQTGLFDKIGEQGSVTIYAVENAQMSHIQQLDTDSMKMYMAYHVSYGRFFKNDLIKNSRVKMLNGKYHNVSVENNIPVIDGIHIQEENILCGNGVIHIMENAFALQKNVYEKILDLPDNYSIIKNYIQDNDTLIFDRANSSPIGVNETGNTIYDTVWIQTNQVLQGVDGEDVREEDAFFTAFIPANDVVTNAYNSVRDYYLQATGEPLEEEMDEFLYEWCHESLFFKGKVRDVKADTMLTLINDAKYLLSVQQVNETSKQSASNGELYVVEYLQIPKYLWMEEVQIIPRYIWYMDTETRDQYRTLGPHTNEYLEPGIGWYNLYNHQYFTYPAWAVFKTFMYDENFELKDVAIVPGEYDIYVKSTVESYGIWQRAGWQEVWLNDKRLCDREYPAYDYANCTNEGFYLGRDVLPDEWGVAQADLKIIALRPGPSGDKQLMFDWIKFIPTSNNY